MVPDVLLLYNSIVCGERELDIISNKEHDEEKSPSDITENRHGSATDLLTLRNLFLKLKLPGEIQTKVTLARKSIEDSPNSCDMSCDMAVLKPILFEYVYDT